ncbi:hypothetical protein ACQ4N7_13410 [Nodosilinea sp. AN01ver1]|uniref:hypothetical protein n=1 Tax=Nodosilinea sp. AN01ver1 TaxID=3423362 RepID=UPI003D31A92E
MSLNSQALPDYERHLLAAMAFFLGRDSDAQARACLCMYLRQAEPRIMAQVRYYAHQISAQTGKQIAAYDLLQMIVDSPEAVAAALPHLGRVHNDDQPDIFS